MINPFDKPVLFGQKPVSKLGQSPRLNALLNKPIQSDQILFSGSQGAEKPSPEFILQNIGRATNWQVREVGTIINNVNPAFQFDIDGETYGLYTADYGKKEYLLKHHKKDVVSSMHPTTPLSEEAYTELTNACQAQALPGIEQLFDYDAKTGLQAYLLNIATEMSTSAKETTAEELAGIDFDDITMGGYQAKDFHNYRFEQGDHFTICLPQKDGQKRNLTVWPEYDYQNRRTDNNLPTLTGYTIKLYTNDYHTNNPESSYAFFTSDEKDIKAIQILSRIASLFNRVGLLIALQNPSPNVQEDMTSFRETLKTSYQEDIYLMEVLQATLKSL